jgi:hypothetical protein
MSSSSSDDGGIAMKQFKDKHVEEDEEVDGGTSREDELDLVDSASGMSSDAFEEGMASSGVPPVCLSFNDLSYSVRIKKGPFADGIKGLGPKLKSCRLWTKESKEILKPMSGHFLPGRLVAIMGPSGIVTTPLSTRYIYSIIYLLFIYFTTCSGWNMMSLTTTHATRMARMAHTHAQGRVRRRS